MPYDPGIQSRGDVYISRGQEQAWQMAGAAIEGLIADSKKAKALRQSLTAYAPEGDLGKAYTAKLQTMGLPELEGEMQSQVLKRAVAANEQQSQLNAARIDEANRQKAAEAAAVQAVGQAGQVSPMDTLNLGRGPINPQPVPVTSETLMRAISQNPQAINSKAGAGILERALMEQSANTENPLVFDRSSLPNATVVKSKGGAGFQIWPNPSSGQAQAITGPNGENLGYGLPGRGGELKPIASDTIKQTDRYKALSSRLNTLIHAQSLAFSDTARQSYQTQIDSVDKEIGALEAGAGTQPATNAPAAGASAYKSADEVKAAVTSGKLKRDDALKILREQFGYK